MYLLKAHAFTGPDNGAGILRLKNIFKHDRDVSCSIGEYAFDSLLFMIRNKLGQVFKYPPLSSCHHGIGYTATRQNLMTTGSVAFTEFIANFGRAFVIFFVNGVFQEFVKLVKRIILEVILL